LWSDAMASDYHGFLSRNKNPAATVRSCDDFATHTSFGSDQSKSIRKQA